MADNIPIEHRFHFDLSGFLVLRNVLTPEECETTLNVLSDLGKQDIQMGVLLP